MQSRIVTAVTLLVASALAAPAARGDPDAMVACKEGGRTVFKRASDCDQTGGRGRAIPDRDLTRPSGWASLDGDRGLTLAPVVACRAQAALRSLVGAYVEDQHRLAQELVDRGACTRLAPETPFSVSAEQRDLLRIDLPDRGSLWVSPTERVPEVAALQMGGQPLTAAPEEPRARGFTEKERRALERKLAEEEIHPDYRRRFAQDGGGGGRRRPPSARAGGAARSHGGGGSRHGDVEIDDWNPAGCDRNGCCASVRVVNAASGSRGLNASDFIADLRDGGTTSGDSLGRGDRLLDPGEETSETVCFEGDPGDTFSDVRMR